MDDTLTISNLHVSIDSEPILKGVNLEVKKGETHAIMGPNGSGKSTLANTLMGHPRYIIDQGDILLNGESMVKLTPDKRAKKGLFLAFQYPHEVSGVSVFNFLRSSYNSVTSKPNVKPMSIIAFRKYLREKMNILNIDDEFVKRYLNEGFSGGERKRNEILQMAVLEPKLTILDEPDSGLDIDAVQRVAEEINELKRPDTSALLITHYQRILNYVIPDVVHILIDGRIRESGGRELALKVEAEGYDQFEKPIASSSPNP